MLKVELDQAGHETIGRVCDRISPVDALHQFHGAIGKHYLHMILVAGQYIGILTHTCPHQLKVARYLWKDLCQKVPFLGKIFAVFQQPVGEET